MDPKALIEAGDRLFSKRGTLMSMWQTCAENFYPERADFTVNRTLGDQFADHLMTSYPLLVRRDLGNSLGTMLRPNSLDWFDMTTDRADKVDQLGRQWLEWASGVQRRAMYDRASRFTRASKESDHDVATFGQAVKTIEVNREGNGLLYRCWHLRDTAWCEGAEGAIDTVHRKWKPTCADLVHLYGDAVHQKVSDKVFGAKKDPYCEVNCRHIVMPAEYYDGDYKGRGSNRRKPKWVEIALDVDNLTIMEAVGLNYFKYVIPRWQTVSGSQYSFSPATVCGLPDARLLQDMTRVILEAGEKATNPPMVGVGEAIRGDVSVFAGGITWVDAQYDERLGEVLRPLTQDMRGASIGVELRQDIKEMLTEAFFLNKFTLPAPQQDMTAYEVSQRVADYIRQAAPLFEPLEDEDNAAVCEVTFELMMRHGAFGDPADIPQSLRGEEVQFKFRSPLHEAVERQKGQRYQEAQALLASTLSLDPTISANVDITTAFRDVLNAIGVPAKWIRPEDQAAKIVAREKQRQAAAQTLAMMEQGGQAALSIGQASQALQGAQAAA